MKIGYLRVSTRDQRLDRQINGLNALCDRFYCEKLSANARKRPIFDKVLKMLTPEDTLIVWDLDRAFRNAEEALYWERTLREKDVTLVAMNFHVDTSTSNGLYNYTMEAAAAVRERMKISERTLEGLEIAAEKGNYPGRPPKLTKLQIMEAYRKINEENATLCMLAAKFGVHPWTLSRNIKKHVASH